MMEITLESNPYLSRFEKLEKGMNGSAPSWLMELRKSAIQRFAELGFPTTKEEAWRFTNVAPIAKASFEPFEPGDAGWTVDRLEALTFGGPDIHRIVFVNGRYSAGLSALGNLPKGVRVESLSDAMTKTPDDVHKALARHAQYENQAFAALNTAFFSDGVFVQIPDGVNCEGTLHVVFATTAGKMPGLSHPRNLVLVGKSSRLTMVQSYVGESGPYLTNAVTEVVADENAVVDHYTLQQESPEAFHTSVLELIAGRSSVVSNQSYTFGSLLTRNDVNLVLAGEGAEGTINGLNVVNGSQHVDNHTSIDHAKPHCASHELYKGVLDGKSQNVFNGRILVRKDAQKTDSKQTNKNLILSPDALVNTNPQLEIYADDVKCTHGATIGQLDETALFYLRSRCIALDEARHILTYAFAGDLVDRIKVPALRARIDTMLAARLRDNTGS